MMFNLIIIKLSQPLEYFFLMDEVGLKEVGFILAYNALNSGDLFCLVKDVIEGIICWSAWLTITECKIHFIEIGPLHLCDG